MARHGTALRRARPAVQTPRSLPAELGAGGAHRAAGAQAPEGPAFCRAVYAGEFGEGRSIDDPTFLGQLLSSCGLPSALVEEANSDAGKQGLRDSVAEAMRLGIFGAPSFIFEGELFWGDDRLEMTLTRAAA
ncbi:DsbA family protein [Seohaeicola zhoushanensis]